MKQVIHPTWYNDCVVTCGCGNTFTTGSTVKAINVDICGACHPFFTGEMKFVDRQGRVDKFMQKMKLAQQKQAAKQTSGKSKKKTDDKKQADAQKSYQQILREQRTNLRQESTTTDSEAKIQPAPTKKTQTDSAK